MSGRLERVVDPGRVVVVPENWRSFPGLGRLKIARDLGYTNVKEYSEADTIILRALESGDAVNR